MPIPAMESTGCSRACGKTKTSLVSSRPGTKNWRRSWRRAHAKFTGTVGVCMATSGPGAIHLLNGLYDAKMDHQRVVAIVGQSATTAIGSQYQQEVDLQSLFKDVASEYCVTVMSPGAVRHCIDRAFRIAIGSTFGHVRHHSQGYSGRDQRCPIRRNTTIMRSAASAARFPT